MSLLSALLSLLVLPWVLVLGIWRWVWRKRKGKGFPKKIAVIGGGIAGCGAAWSLKKSGFDVVIYEAREDLGGNAKTHTWNTPGKPTTGLSVLAWPEEYFRNYNNLVSTLGLETVPVELPFFVNYLPNNSSKGQAFAHGKDTPLRKEFAKDLERWARLVKFIKGVNAFFARSSKPSMYNMSYLNFLNIVPLRFLFFCFGISSKFWTCVVVPIYGSTFLSTHINFVPSIIVPIIDDLIPINGVPKLTTWTANSSEVFKGMTKSIGVFLGHPVTAVRRLREDLIEITTKNGSTERYNAVVFACPADVALKTLAAPSALESLLLSSVSYVEDSDPSFLEGLIHSDPSILPADLRSELLATFSNYIEVTPRPGGGVAYENTFILSSWMPCLQQGLRDRRPMMVTYNLSPYKAVEDPVGKLSNARSHPDLSFRNLAISMLLRFAQGYQNTYFCGSYCTPGNGHDLSLLSGFAVAQAIGADYPFPSDGLAREDFRKLCSLMGM